MLSETDKAPVFQPLARKALADDVLLVLRRMIIRQELKPGEKITESGIAAQLGVSRTPVREAFQRLTYEEFLIDRPGRSPQVSPISVCKVQEVYPLVAVLEGLAARLACPRLTESDLAQMEEWTRQMASHARHGEIQGLVEADAQFHGVLHQRAENAHLQKVICDLRLRTARMEYTFFSTSDEVRLSVLRHKKLVRVLRSGNARRAQKTLEKQWDLGRQALLRIIEKNTPAVGAQDESAALLAQVRKLARESAAAF